LLTLLVAQLPGVVDVHDPESHWVIALFAILVHLRAFFQASEETHFDSRDGAVASALALDWVRGSVWLGALSYCLSIWGAAIYALTVVLS
jgi:hypothetical protein